MRINSSIKSRLREPFAHRLSRWLTNVTYFLYRLFIYIFTLSLVLGVAHLITVLSGVPIFDINWLLRGQIDGIDSIMFFVFGWFVLVFLLDWAKYK